MHWPPSGPEKVRNAYLDKTVLFLSRLKFDARCYFYRHSLSWQSPMFSFFKSFGYSSRSLCCQSSSHESHRQPEAHIVYILFCSVSDHWNHPEPCCTTSFPQKSALPVYSRLDSSLCCELAVNPHFGIICILLLTSIAIQLYSHQSQLTLLLFRKLLISAYERERIKRTTLSLRVLIF